MMRSLVGASLKSRGLILALGAAVMLFGVIQVANMPRDVLPEFGPPTVEVRTEALGLSSLEVEQLITAPMEQNLLNGVAFLDVIRSESVPGLSSIVMLFEPGTDLMRARQVVQERLIQAHGELPPVAKPPQMLQPLSSTSRVMMVRLSSEQLSLIEQSVLARWTIRPRLLGVPGVANVAVWGQRERQLQVQVDPERLASEGVTLDQIIETTGNALWVSPLTFLEASIPGTGGFIDTPNQRLGIQHLLPIDSPEDLARVPIEGCTLASTAKAPSATRHVDANCPANPDAGAARPTPLVLGDVATVVEDHQPLIGDAVFADGQSLMLVIEKFPEANALEVTKGVEAALDGLGPGLSDMKMDTSVYRPASYLERSNENVVRGLLVGSGLVILVLGLLMSSWRRLVLTVVPVLVSLGAAVAVLHFTGATLNAMVVAGLGLALVVLVDDAVADGDGMLRHLGSQAAAEPASRAKTMLEHALRVRGPLAYATVITLLTLLPVVVLRGETGAFLPPLALAYAAAVLVSMLVSLTVTPALSSLMLGRVAPEPSRPTLLSRVARRYSGLLPRLLPRWGLVAGAIILISGLAVLPLLERRRSLMPAFKDPDVLIQWEGAAGTSLPEMSRITRRVEREIGELDGVRSVGAHVGRAVQADQVVGANSSEIWVSMEPSADHDEMISSIEDVVGGYPGLQSAVVTYPTERARAVLTAGGEDDVAVRIYGQDFGIMRDKAEEVRRALADIDGVVAPAVERQAEEPTLEVTVDLAAARAAQIKPGDVRRAAAALLSGIEVGNLFEEQKVFEVVVWGAPESRNSIHDISQLLIDTPAGGRVRLGDVARVEIKASPNVIRHEAVSRSIDVRADVSGRSVEAVLDDLDDRLEQIEFPLEHHAEVLVDHSERQAAQRRFLAVAAGAALGILLLLQVAFSSWRLAGAVMAALPSALAGGLIAAAVSGEPVTIGTVAGLLAVVALAARSAVLLIGRLSELRQREGQGLGSPLVVRAVQERTPPVITTAATIAAVMLPLVVLGNIAGLEILHSMSVVVVGGLLTSTVLTLLVLPALYLRFAPRLDPAHIEPPLPDIRYRESMTPDRTSLDRHAPAPTA